MEPPVKDGKCSLMTFWQSDRSIGFELLLLAVVGDMPETWRVIGAGSRFCDMAVNGSGGMKPSIVPILRYVDGLDGAATYDMTHRG